MTKGDLFYGLDSQERLDSDPDDTVDGVLENACEKVGEGFDAIADRIKWPIRVLVYRRMNVLESRASRLAGRVLEYVLEDLDDDFADSEGTATDPTQPMNDAATAFVNAVVSEYIPFACEPTGEVIEYTREQAGKGEKIVTAKTRGRVGEV